MFVSSKNPIDRYVLVVDAGNTVIKWVVFCKESIVWRGCDNDIEGQPFDIDCIYFASVRDDVSNTELLNTINKKYPNVVCVTLDVQKRECNVENAYDEPYRLGIDRWLGVLSVYHQFNSAVVIVDAGTAIKIDVVNGEGKHLGGYITPSSKMMEASLVENTGRIRFSEKDMDDVTGLPKNTGQAVRMGCNEMILGFIERVLKRYSESKYVFTGGNGEYLMNQLMIDGLFDSDLVVKGAKLLGDARVIIR
ncbi:type III pantothenate kinase [Marinomonas algicola]|uniref:type III pantothenate kinase n=1 Tax=Marinomonas algicola TaxID=2773454 RepID=UPI00174E0088|nr:type III pantothenate kinase [Marinomonas algicola]